MEEAILGYKHTNKSKDGLVTCRGNDTFVDKYDKICLDNENKTQEWIKRLVDDATRQAFKDAQNPAVTKALKELAEWREQSAHSQRMFP